MGAALRSLRQTGNGKDAQGAWDGGVVVSVGDTALVEAQAAARKAPLAAKGFRKPKWQAKELEGKVVCTQCEQVAFGDYFAYPEMWDTRDVVYLRSGISKCLPPPSSQVFIMPKVSQGNHEEFSHNETMAHSIDIALPHGTAILAGRAGVVVDNCGAFSKGGAEDKFKRKANFVIIRHDDGTYARYFHVQHDSVTVSRGEQVEEGQLIARCGSTGFSEGPHLHFDVVDCYLKETSVLSLHTATTTSSNRNESMNTLHFESAFASFSRVMEPSEVIEVAPIVANPITLQASNNKNEHEFAGKIVICKRGGNSSFLTKALAAQAGGAVGLIVINTPQAVDDILPLLGPSNAPESALVVIPVVVVSHLAGESMLQTLRKTSQTLLKLAVSPYFHRRILNPVEGVAFCKPMTQPILFQDGVFFSRRESWL